MFQIAIIFFRESLEIALLLGVIFAATNKIYNRNFYVGIGLIIGIILSILLAIFTKKISTSFNGLGGDIFNIILLTIAIFLMGGTLIWMKEKSYELTNNIHKVSKDIEQSNQSKWILTGVITSCILREGSEIVLFTYGLLAGKEVNQMELLGGISLGISLGLISGFSLYYGLVKISGKYLFKVSEILLMFIAAGLASSLANLLIQAGFITALDYPIWDSSWLVKDNSILGEILCVTMGYTSRPSILQLIFFVATIIIINLLTQKSNKKVSL